MSGGIINLSLAPSAWAHLQTDALLALGRRLDASPATSLVLEDPDAGNAPGPWRWESSTGVGALVAVTGRIGLVLSVCSGYTDPFTASRRVGSLDNLSGGRVGWLLDPGTSSERDRRTRAVSRDLGVNDPIGRATELVAASRALWDSWDRDALRLDVATNQLVDESRISRVDFSGEHFQLTGQTNLRRPPSGNPPLHVRVAGPGEVDLAARLADIVLATDLALADAVLAAARQAGRPRPPVVLLSGAPDALDPATPPPGPASGYDVLIDTPARLDQALQALETADPAALSNPVDGRRPAPAALRN